ncbi:hypothetical protein [Polaromonas naphthalenivorans]|nr:hypothetical protein [Polaromonas naphthalenivorans]
MKSIVLAFAAVIATTATAWATPTPITLTHTQLTEIVQSASDDTGTLKSLAGVHLVIDLRPGAMYPYFVAADNVHGLAFICQVGFEDFGGGPVTATVIRYERGEDGRGYVKLDACTPQER